MTTIPLSGDLRFPGHGLPSRPDGGDLSTPWARLIAGQPHGQKTNLAYDAARSGDQNSPVTILDVQGPDANACQLMVTLAQPLAIPRAAAGIGIDIQNQTGELNNAQVGAANYPGTGSPIIWPPFVALVEWGVGGTRTFAEIDWIQGANINTPASWLRVHALVPADAANAPEDATSGLYTLAAFVNPGYPRSGNAQRTIWVGQIADGAESAVFAVPPFARKATVLSIDPADAAPVLTSAALRLWRDPAGGANVGNYQIAGNDGDPFFVPNAANYFTVRNTGMGAPYYFAVLFELAI